MLVRVTGTGQFTDPQGHLADGLPAFEEGMGLAGVGQREAVRQQNLQLALRHESRALRTIAACACSRSVRPFHIGVSIITL